MSDFYEEPSNNEVTYPSQESVDTPKTSPDNEPHQCNEMCECYEQGYKAAYDEYTSDIESKIEALREIRERNFSKQLSRIK